MDDQDAGRSARAYSVSAARAFPSVDYGSGAITGPPLLALNTTTTTTTAAAAAAVPDPFDLADDDDDDHADADGSQPTPTNSFFAFRADRSRAGSRASSRATSRAGSRAVSPSGGTGQSSTAATASRSRNQSRSTSRVPSRRPSVAEASGEAVAGQAPLAVPQLISAHLFLPLPNTDPLSTLLSKFIPAHLRPPRDADGAYDGQTVEQLVGAGSWRALARLARDTVVSCDAEDVGLIFDMFHLRHLALLNLHLPSLHERELALLFHAIASLPALTRAGLTARDAVPFGLEVMLAQTKGVDALNGLVRRCKGAVRRSADPQQKVVWRERLRRVGVVLAGLLIDIGESVAALHLLGPLVRSPSAPAYVLLAAHRLHLLTGDLAAAARVRARLASPGAASGAGEKAVAGALESLARGEWEQAGEGLAGVLQNTPPDASDALVAATTLSVSQLYSSQPDQAIATLEAAVGAAPSAALLEVVIFNLTTLYELRLGAAAATQRKLELLVKVAQWEGDGLRPACLKLT